MGGGAIEVSCIVLSSVRSPNKRKTIAQSGLQLVSVILTRKSTGGPTIKGQPMPARARVWRSTERARGHLACHKTWLLVRTDAG